MKKIKPSINWEEINNIIHDAKNVLTLIVEAENQLRKARKKVE